MNWIKQLFSKKSETKQCDIRVVVGSSYPKREQTYMHIETGTGRPYVTNHPPHVQKWCNEQLQINSNRCRC